MEVFLGFDAACGVDEASGGSKSLEVGGKEEALPGKELFDALGRVAPTGVGTATENTGVGAGKVEEDAVEMGRLKADG